MLFATDKEVSKYWSFAASAALIVATALGCWRSAFEYINTKYLYQLPGRCRLHRH